MVPLARHGPQRGACHLWILSQVKTSTVMPLGLLPRPWDCLGATVQGCSHPGPQGETRGMSRRNALMQLPLCRSATNGRPNNVLSLMPHPRPCRWSPDAPSSQEMEHRLSSLQTSLTTVERSITRYENLIEDCRMQEEEACQEEEIFHEQEEEESPSLRWQ